MVTVPYLAADPAVDAASLTSLAVPVTGQAAGTGSGDAIVVAVMCNSGTVTGVADTRGNSYRLVKSDTAQVPTYHWQADEVNNSGGPTPLTNADTVTVTFDTIGAYKVVAVVGVPGLTSSPVDRTPSNHNSSSTTPSVSTASALSQADEICIAICGYGAGGTMTWDSGWTSLTDTESAPTHAYLSVAYKLAATADIETASGTLQNAAKWAITLVTLKVPPITVVTTSLPGGVIGDTYSQALTSSGGIGSVTWSIISGSLPAGLSISPEGSITGVRTTAEPETITFQASDGIGALATGVVTIGAALNSGPVRDRWQVIARDPDLNLRGFLPWKKITIDHRHCDVSTWTLAFPATPAVLSKLGPGWGVVVLRYGKELLSGPLEDDGPRSWSADSDGGMGTVTVTGADDLVIVANELAYPDPTKDAAGQTGAAYQDTQGPAAAETVIKHYVSANVGSTRASARADASAPDVRTVVVAADQARGDVVSFSARFHGLLDIIKAISQAGSNLGAQVIQQDGELVFDVYEPRDLTARMRFSRESGTLRSIDSSVSMPTLTHAVVLGSGSNNAQVIVERKDSVAAENWRMAVRQTVDDSGTSDTSQLDQAGDAALADGKRQWARNVTIVETAQVRYPDSLGRGDLVTIVDPTRDDATITDIVTSVHIEVDADAGTELIQLNVGVADSTSTGNDLVDLVKVVKRRVHELQRRTP